jgi:ABC-type multidrug transport system fused ATPase/permease subunit
VTGAETTITERTPVPWGRVFRYLLPYWKVELGLIALMVAGIAMSMVWPAMLREVVDGVLIGGDHARLPSLVGTILVTTGLGFGLSGLSGWAQAWVTSRVLLDLRRVAYHHVLLLGPAWLARRRTGDVLSRLGSDLAELQAVATTTIMAVLGSIITLVAVLTALTVLEPTLLLVGLAAVPLAVVLLAVLRPRIRRLALRVRERTGDVSQQLVEGLAGLRTVRAHALVPREIGRFMDTNEALVRDGLRLTLWNVLTAGSFQVLVVGNLVLVLWVGTRLVSREAMTLGDLFAFALYQQRVYGPLQGLAGTWLGLQKAAAATARVFEILDARPLAAGTGETPSRLRGELRFEDVHFAWEPGRPVLEGASFRAPVGATTALVGPSGVGKSTALDLVFRFVDPQQGRVLLDGADRRDWSEEDLRGQVALLTQQPHLVTGTVRENLALLIPGVAEDEQRSKLAEVGLLGFVESLPQGLDTPLGDRGVRLSEGQRQRLGLARALLLDPPLLVLDEVTAALDWENDRLVVEAIARRRGRGRTTLVVTHRLQLAMEADNVVVLEGGRVAEQGSPDDLRAAGGAFSRLLQLQARASRA